MHVAVYLALFAALAVPVLTRIPGAERLADHRRPLACAIGLVAGALTLAACSTLALVLLVLDGLDTLTGDAGASPSTSGPHEPRDPHAALPDSALHGAHHAPWGGGIASGGVGHGGVGHGGVTPAVAVLVGALAAVVLATVGARMARTLTRLARQYRAACRAVPAGAVAREPVLVSDATTPARSLPVRGGHILVAQQCWDALDASQRAAVLAHERAHLEHHHHLAVATTAVAAAVNPLLAPLESLVAYALERDADERAAARAGGRRALAHTLGALATSITTTKTHTARVASEIGVVAGIASCATVARVRALLQHPAPHQRAAARAVTILGALAVVAALGLSAHATVDLCQLLDTGPR